MLAKLVAALEQTSSPAPSEAKLPVRLRQRAGQRQNKVNAQLRPAEPTRPYLPVRLLCAAGSDLADYFVPDRLSL